jgi:hypothetical protein
MSNLGKTILKFNSSAVAAALTIDITDLIRRLKILFNPYRPELHYMRGAGPKWHAKHDQPLDRTNSDSPAPATLATGVRFLTEGVLQSTGAAAILFLRESRLLTNHGRLP